MDYPGTKISIKAKNLNVEKVDEIISTKISGNNQASYSVFICFDNPNIRGSEVYKKTLAAFGKRFSPKIQPVFFASVNADISSTPRGRFNQQVEEGVGFLVDITSNRKVHFYMRSY